MKVRPALGHNVLSPSESILYISQVCSSAPVSASLILLTSLQIEDVCHDSIFIVSGGVKVVRMSPVPCLELLLHTIKTDAQSFYGCDKRISISNANLASELSAFMFTLVSDSAIPVTHFDEAAEYFASYSICYLKVLVVPGTFTTITTPTTTITTAIIRADLRGHLVIIVQDVTIILLKFDLELTLINTNQVPE